MRLAVHILFILIALPVQSEMFAAAGRIEDPASGGICSASLIRPDVIVTAAHCISDLEDPAYVFRSSIPGTEPVRVERFVLHPFYVGFKEQRFRRLRFDIAVGQLAAPADVGSISPFSLGNEAEKGEGLFLASWRQRSGSRPRLRRCFVIEGQVAGIVTLGCQVRGGESGAPVLRLTVDGLELVAIINSTARYKGQQVALAADVRLRIPPLLGQLSRAP